MNTDNMRETFDIPVILTKSFTDSFEAEKKNYAYKGKPLTWQQGFTKGFHEGYQAAHADIEKDKVIFNLYHSEEYVGTFYQGSFSTEQKAIEARDYLLEKMKHMDWVKGEFVIEKEAIDQAMKDSD